MTLPLSYSRLNSVQCSAFSVQKQSFAHCSRLASADTETLADTSTMLLRILELMTGIEPVTSPLPRECSTN